MKNMTGAIYVAGALDYETRKRVSINACSDCNETTLPSFSAVCFLSDINLSKISFSKRSKAGPARRKHWWFFGLVEY